MNFSMDFNVITTRFFERQFKRLAKKYASLNADLRLVTKELKQNPTMGDPLGRNCYKIRMAIESKGRGKSGGARVISYVEIVENTVYLLSIYDKAETETISDTQLNDLLKLIE
jgi:mRNA-degrading endonuclease RelE of RelBE toxin-antitoxin system